MSNPLAGANLGIISFSRCGSHHAVRAPVRGDFAQGKEIILPFDRCQFCQQREIRSEASQCFDKTRDFLAGGIENPVIALRIIEAIAERSIQLRRPRPIGSLPGIGLPSNAINRLWRNLCLKRQWFLAPSDERPSSSKNFGRYQREVSLA